MFFKKKRKYIFRKNLKFTEKDQDLDYRNYKKEESEEIKSEAEIPTVQESVIPPKIKPWRFINFTERILYRELYDFWIDTYTEFTRIESDSIGKTQEMQNRQTDFLVFESDIYGSFEHMIIEMNIPRGYSRENINYYEQIVPEDHEPLNDYRHDISFFLAFFFGTIFEILIGNMGSVHWLLLFLWIHYLEYEWQGDEDDPSVDMEDLIITSTYSMGLELHSYWYATYRDRKSVV